MFAGLVRSENVGMSNRNLGESPRGRKPKGSVATVIVHGLGGPKTKPKRRCRRRVG
jgi:hypothetical protein